MVNETKQKEENIPDQANVKSSLSLELMRKYSTSLTIKLNTTTYVLLTPQKILAKVGSILTFTTDKLLQMRNAASTEVDQLITMNTDALALLGHTMQHY